MYEIEEKCIHNCGQKPLETMFIWESNIKMNLKEVWFADCIHLAHDVDQWHALVNLEGS
jgi:hypothetical protein